MSSTTSNTARSCPPMTRTRYLSFDVAAVMVFNGGDHSHITMPLSLSATRALCSHTCRILLEGRLAARIVGSVKLRPRNSSFSSTSPSGENWNILVSVTNETSSVSKNLSEQDTLKPQRSVICSIIPRTPISSMPTPLRTLRRLPSLKAPEAVTIRAWPEENS